MHRPMATSSKALRRRSLPHVTVPNGTGFQPFQPQLAEDSLCSFTAPSFEELLRSVKMVSPVFRNKCSPVFPPCRQRDSDSLLRRQFDMVTTQNEAESTHAMFIEHRATAFQLTKTLIVRCGRFAYGSRVILLLPYVTLLLRDRPFLADEAQ